MLDVPVVNAVSRIECKDGALLVERALEGCVEVLEVSLPAVVSVTSDANLPRIPQLKDILAAGKKPVTVWSLDEVGGLTPSGVEVRDVWAPEGAARKNVVYEGCTPESISALAADVRAAL